MPSSLSPSIPEPVGDPGKDAPSAGRRDTPVPPWWAGELSPARRGQLLESAAAWVVRKGLEAPAVMFLEMHKPLTTMASVAYAMGQPPLMFLFGFRRTEELRLLLSDRDNVEALMQRIERRSKEHHQPSRGRQEPASAPSLSRKAGEP